MKISETSQGQNYRILILSGKIFSVDDNNTHGQLELIHETLLPFRVDGYNSSQRTESETLEPTGLISKNLEGSQLLIKQSFLGSDEPTNMHCVRTLSILTIDMVVEGGEEKKEYDALIYLTFKGELYLAKAKILPSSPNPNYMPPQMNQGNNFCKINK